MNAAAIVAHLTLGGCSLLVDGRGKLVVRPAPPAELVEPIRQQKPEIVAYIREYPASAHPYALFRNAVDPSGSVCIACGTPPMLHGLEPLEGAVLIDSPNRVAIIDARSIVSRMMTGSAASTHLQDQRLAVEPLRDPKRP